ncbi:MAG TPA: hypothetical protein VF002_10135 [Gaiellaceae bacterium]
MADDEQAAARALAQAAKGGRVAQAGLVEALAPREAVAAAVRALPGPVLLDRLPFELADLDVVEERLRLQRHVSPLEREGRGLARALEARVQARLEWQRAKLQAE